MDSPLAQRLDAYRATHPANVVSAGARDFAYTVGGVGDRTVVVLHGGGSIAEAAHPFCIALEAHFRVVAIDWPASARTVHDVVVGIDAVLAAVGAARVSLLGFSMGGMIAQRWAHAHADDIDALVLFVSMGPSARYAKKFARYRRVMALVPDRLLRAASRKAVARWAVQGALQDPQAAAFIAAQRRGMFDAGKVTKATLLSDADILVDFFSSDFALGISGCPMLIIEAANDRMVDVVERAALKARYPQARVVTVADTDHFAGVLAPPPMVAEIRGFLLASQPAIPT